MLDVIIIFAIISVASFLFLLVLMIFAPVGWEDENGFHYSKKK